MKAPRRASTLAASHGYMLITGASGGIGAELARIAAADGWHLVLVARRKSRLTELARELHQAHKVDVISIALDLAERGAPEKLVAQLDRRRLTITALVNNAGFGASGPFIDSDLPIQRSMMRLNMAALTELTYLLLPAMVERGAGRILNVGSVAGFMAGPYMSVYYATKAFVLSFSEALHEELKSCGVSVTCLAPGPTDTDFAEAAKLDDSHPVRRSVSSATTVARVGYDAMMRGTAIAVPGVLMKVTVALVDHVLPRRLVRWVIGRAQK